MTPDVLDLIISVALAMGGAIGFMEMRLSKMYQQIQEKIDDKNAINQVIQESLKEDILRLEHKIDMLIRLNIKEIKSKSSEE